MTDQFYTREVYQKDYGKGTKQYINQLYTICYQNWDDVVYETTYYVVATEVLTEEERLILQTIVVVIIVLLISNSSSSTSLFKNTLW